MTTRRSRILRQLAAVLLFAGLAVQLVQAAHWDAHTLTDSGEHCIGCPHADKNGASAPALAAGTPVRVDTGSAIVAVADSDRAQPVAVGGGPRAPPSY